MQTLDSLKCNNLNYLDFRYLQNCENPFNSLSSNKNFLACCTSSDNNIQWSDPENDHDSSLSLKPSSSLELSINQFNNATPENNNDPEKIYSSK